MPEISPKVWENFLAKCPDAHLLQTILWGEFKSEFGWEVIRLALETRSRDEPNTIGAQILFRPLPLGFRLAYLPKGPVVDCLDIKKDYNWKTFWEEVDQICRKKNSIFLIVEPDVLDLSMVSGNIDYGLEVNIPSGFRKGLLNVQPLRTIVVDLRGTEEEILKRMKQKTRYNIRLAAKKGVTVAPSDDISTFHQLMEITSERDAFEVHSLDYFQQAYNYFHSGGQCELFMASIHNEPVAALMAFARGRRAWYFYGASSNLHRELMPNYLLQWEAMRWARKKGCWIYDLWGVPDHEEPVLEANFYNRSDGLWGVYRFKRGFGGQLVRAPGPWDRVYKKNLYSIYHIWIKLLSSGFNEVLTNKG